MKTNKKLAGVAMAYFQEQAILREAEASCKLDGDTQSCETCPLGKDYREKIEAETRQECWEDLERWAYMDLQYTHGDYILRATIVENLKKKWRIK